MPAQTAAQRLASHDAKLARKDGQHHLTGSRVSGAQSIAARANVYISHNFWQLAIGVGVIALFLGRMHIGDWLVEQVRLTSALLTTPLSEAASADNGVLFAQVMTILAVVALLLSTVGNQDYWAETVDSIPVLLGWQKLAIKWLLLRKLKGIVLVLAIRQVVMLWSWGFRSPLYDPGPVPVLPASAAGFHYRQYASLRLDSCNESVWPGATGTAQGHHPIARALAGSQWALFSRTGMPVQSPSDLRQSVLDTVCGQCRGCGDKKDANLISDAELARLDDVVLNCIHSRGLQASGVGCTGTGVQPHSGSIPKDHGDQAHVSTGPRWGESRDQQASNQDLQAHVESDKGAVQGEWAGPIEEIWHCDEAASIVQAVVPYYARPMPGAIKLEMQWLSDEHVWAPFPVVTRVPMVHNTAVTAAESARRRLDAALMLAVYLSTVLLLSALDLQIIHLPLASKFSRRMSHIALIGLHACALGLMRTYGRLNRAGVPLPEAAIIILTRATLPILLIGIVSLLCGLGTSQLIKEHMGTQVVGITLIASINLIVGLWASRAGDALAEALSADTAAVEGLGIVGGDVPLYEGIQSDLPTKEVFAIAGAGALSEWLAAPASIWASVATLQGGIFTPMPLLYGVVLRFLALSFVVWVISLWIRWALFVVSSADIFGLELGLPTFPTRPVVSEQPKLLEVLETIFRDFAVTQDGAADDVAEADGAADDGAADDTAGLARSASGASHTSKSGLARSATTTEEVVNKIALNIFGMAHAMDRLRNFRDRLVLSQRMDIDILNLLPRRVVTGRVSLQLSVAPPPPPPPTIIMDSSVSSALWFLPSLIASLASTIPPPPPPPSPLITATIDRLDVPSEDERRAQDDLPPTGRASTTPIKLTTDVKLELGLHAIASLVRSSSALGSHTAMGTVRLSLIIDPPPLLSAQLEHADTVGGDRGDDDHGDSQTAHSGAAAPAASTSTFLSVLQSSIASAGRTLRALTDVTSAQRREVDLITWHEGECSGILGNMRPPTTADLDAQRSKLLAMASDLKEMVADAQLCEMRAAGSATVDQSKAEKKLRESLQAAERVVRKLVKLTSSLVDKPSSEALSNSIQESVVEAAFVLATVHRAEIWARPDRQVTHATLTRMSTVLIELFLQSLLSSYSSSTAFPIGSVALGCLMCAVQWRYSTRSAHTLSRARGQRTGFEMPFTGPTPQRVIIQSPTTPPDGPDASSLSSSAAASSASAATAAATAAASSAAAYIASAPRVADDASALRVAPIPTAPQLDSTHDDSAVDGTVSRLVAHAGGRGRGTGQSEWVNRTFGPQN